MLQDDYILRQIREMVRAVMKMLFQVSAVELTPDVIEDTEDIEQYGFSSPTNEVTISTAAGETTFTIGMQNSITDKYYLMVNYDQSKVYVTDSSMLTACGYSIEDLTPEETTE